MLKNLAVKLLISLVIIINIINKVNSSLFPDIDIINPFNGYIYAKGQIKCNGMPLKYVNVKLMDRDFGDDNDDMFDSIRTDYNGNFTISGRVDDPDNKPDPYLLIEYKFSSIYYGRINIKDGYSLNTAYDITGKRPYSLIIDYGVINLNNKKCNTYLNILNSIIEYKYRTGIQIPMYNLNIQLDQPYINNNEPYSTIDTIYVPNDYNNSHGLDILRSRHELAKVVRNYYDGNNWSNYLKNVINYDYSRLHSCSTNSNYGFAFYEGWAQFWTGECLNNIGTTYTIEGNVASALRKLKNNCNSNYYKMINVLKSNPGTIDSFNSYNNAHNTLYGCKI